MSSIKKEFVSQAGSSLQRLKSHKKQGMSEDEEQEAKEAFELFDPDRRGSISYHELKVVLRALGFQVKKSEVVQLAREFDVEETGRVAYQDYIDIMSRKYSQRDPIEETLRAFHLFDLEGRGKISITDLKRVARELGETLKEDQLNAMIEEFDQDGDGCINEEEFLAIIRPSPF